MLISVQYLPVGLEVLESRLQVVEQVDLLAALGAVDVQQLAVVQVPDLLRCLARTKDNRRQEMRTIWLAHRVRGGY